MRKPSVEYAQPYSPLEKSERVGPVVVLTIQGRHGNLPLLIERTGRVYILMFTALIPAVILCSPANCSEDYKWDSNLGDINCVYPIELDQPLHNPLKGWVLIDHALPGQIDAGRSVAEGLPLWR